jgi:hypothetical protein
MLDEIIRVSVSFQTNQPVEKCYGRVLRGRKASEISII